MHLFDIDIVGGIYLAEFADESFLNSTDFLQLHLHAYSYNYTWIF